MNNIKSRQLKLLLRLLEVKKTSYSQLAEQFEVSKKTIMRDIDSLSSIGVPIYTQPGHRGGIFIDESYKFNSNFFNPQEIEDIILAFRIIDNIRGKQDKNNVLQKLELLVPELAFLKEYDLSEYLTIELLSKSVKTDTLVCNTINMAFDEEKMISITTDKYNHIVAPIRYVLKPNGLCLICIYNNKDLIIPIDEIKCCELTKVEFNRDTIKNKILKE